MRGFTVGAAAVGGIAAVTAGITVSAREAIVFEDKWAQADKTLGMTPEILAEHRRKIDLMGAELRMRVRVWIEMSAEFGRQGLSGMEASAEAVDLAAMAATAFEVALARMTEVFGGLCEHLDYSIVELDAWANKVNWLGDNTAGSEAAISSYALAVQGIAKNAGLSEDAFLALGAGMIAMKRPPEVAATSLRAFLRTMTGPGEDMSKSELDMLHRLGLSSKWDQIQAQFSEGG